MPDPLGRYYDEIRGEERTALRKRAAAAYVRAPRLDALDRERGELLKRVGRGMSAEEGKARLSALAAEERSILAELGLPADALELRYRCNACRDTGWVGEAPRRPCSCRLRIRESQAGAAGINGKETFAAFSEEVYPEEAQRKRALNAKKICEAYAAALPRPGKPNLLILGMPGLGKSYLANAVCYEAICRGIDAKRVTAYRFVQDMLQDIREHTENAARYTAVPLLALDDLGSEPDVNNVSTEWLFAVVNERLLAGKPTVCVTNLSLAELQARYGERVMSRLCDKNATTALRLTGENLRTV